MKSFTTLAALALPLALARDATLIRPMDLHPINQRSAGRSDAAKSKRYRTFGGQPLDFTANGPIKRQFNRVQTRPVDLTAYRHDKRTSGSARPLHRRQDDTDDDDGDYTDEDQEPNELTFDQQGWIRAHETIDDRKPECWPKEEDCQALGKALLDGTAEMNNRYSHYKYKKDDNTLYKLRYFDDAGTDNMFEVTSDTCQLRVVIDDTDIAHDNDNFDQDPWIVSGQTLQMAVLQGHHAGEDTFAKQIMDDVYANFTSPTVDTTGIRWEVAFNQDSPDFKTTCGVPSDS